LKIIFLTNKDLKTKEYLKQTIKGKKAYILLIIQLTLSPVKSLNYYWT